MLKKIILFIGLFFCIASVSIASDQPTKLIPTDGNMRPVAVQYIQNDDGTYDKVNSGSPLPVSGSFALSGDVNINDISKGTQTNDVKITLDGEEITETNSGDIKSALEIIDNFISGSRGLVTEDNSADIKTAIEAINTAVQSGGITQIQLEAIKTALEIIDNAISGSEMQVDVVAPLPTGTNEIGKVVANAGTNLNTSTLLTEAIYTGRIGEVQATPTANTLLSRLKVIADNQLIDGHNVTVDNASLAVTGTFYPATQPVSGTFYQVTQPVSGTFYQATQPVSGTVTSNLSATDNAVLDQIELNTDPLAAIAGDTTSIDGKITACNTGAVTVSAALPSGTNTIGKIESVHSSDSVSVATGSIAFDAGDDLTTEKKTSVIALGDVIAHPDALYLLAIEKPIENTAGNLTVYTYNSIKIDGSTARDVSHSTHTVEKITDTATYQNFLVQGLFIGEEEIKLGMKFTTDSGAITVKYRIYRL